MIDERQEIVEKLLSRGIEAIAGAAAQSGLLAAANLAGAKWLISAIPNPFEAGDLIEQARAVNLTLEIVARAHSDAEVDYLKGFGANLIVMGEREIARAIAAHITMRLDTSDERRTPRRVTNRNARPQCRCPSASLSPACLGRRCAGRQL
jgi:K+:H+ antiporter